MSHEKIASVFDVWAGNGKAEGMQDGHGDVVHQVLDQIEVRAGMVSLDLGCGNGWATRQLGSIAPGASAIGIDASAAMVKRAEELHDLTTRARYEVGTFEAIDFPDGKFDRVFSMEALYYAVDLDLAIAEIHRVTKSGGRGPHPDRPLRRVAPDRALVRVDGPRHGVAARGRVGRKVHCGGLRGRHDLSRPRLARAWRRGNVPAERPLPGMERPGRALRSRHPLDPRDQAGLTVRLAFTSWRMHTFVGLPQGSHAPGRRPRTPWIRARQAPCSWRTTSR